MTSMTASPTDGEELEPEEPEYALIITEPFTRIHDLSTITSKSPKRYITELAALPIMQAATSRTLQERAPFKTGARAGQAQAPLDVKHLWLYAGVPGLFGFIAHWKGGSFESVRVRDAVGWPTQIWSNYEPNARQLKRQKDEPEKAYAARVDELWKRAREMEYLYNGDEWINYGERYLDSVQAFEEWLADLVPGFVAKEKTVTKKQAQASADAVELIEMGEWIG